MRDRVGDSGDDVVPQSIRHRAWCVDSLYLTVTATVRQTNTTRDHLHAHEDPPSGACQQHQSLPLNCCHVELDVERSVDVHVRVFDVGQRLERPCGLAAHGAAVAPATSTPVAI